MSADEEHQVILQQMVDEIVTKNGSAHGKEYEDYYMDNNPRITTNYSSNQPNMRGYEREDTQQERKVTDQREILESTDTDGSVTATDTYTKEFVDMEGKVYDETETETLSVTAQVQAQNTEQPYTQEQLLLASTSRSRKQHKQYKVPPSMDTRRASACLKPFSLRNQNLQENSVENLVYPYVRYPSPAMERYMCTDSPPDYDMVIPFEDIPEPEMFASKPEMPTYINYRGRKKGKMIKEMALQTSDNNFERYGFVPNELRGPYQSFGRDIYQDKRRKRAIKAKPNKILQDAAHTCAIEVDDNGCLAMVLMSDDLAHTDLRFGKQHILFKPEILLAQSEQLKVPSKKHPKKYQVGMRAHAPTTIQPHTIHHLGGISAQQASGEYRSNRLSPNLYYNPEDKFTYAAEVYKVHDDNHLISKLPKVPNHMLKPKKIGGNYQSVGKQVYVVPEHQTDEILLGPWNSRTAYAQRVESSSSEESETERNVSSAEKGVLTEDTWKSNINKAAAKKRYTLIHGTPSQLYELQQNKSGEIDYEGGPREYARRKSLIEEKQLRLPNDMMFYAMGGYDEHTSSRNNAALDSSV